MSYCPECAQFLRENAALKADRDQLRTALEQVEWVQCVPDWADDSFWACPWCRGNLPAHFEGCPRQRALGTGGKGC